MKTELIEKSADGLLTGLSAEKKSVDTEIEGNLLTADASCSPLRKKDVAKGNGLSLLELVKSGALKNEQNALIKILISIQKPSDLELFYAIPPSSFIDSVLKTFKKWTDIVLELPFFVSMSMLGAWLVDNGNYIDRKGRKTWTDTWVFLFEGSGGGKSFVLDMLEKAFTVHKLTPGIQSSAMFIQELQKTPHSLWIRDEISKFFKAMQVQTYLQEVNEYILLMFDNKDISRSTVSGGPITVHNPVVTILGLNTPAEFIENISASMMTDGTMQRFDIGITKPDPLRPPLSVAYYNEYAIEKDIARAWGKLKKPEKGQVYTLGKDSMKTFENTFYSYADNFRDKIPPSFMRRTLFKAIKRALIYHILLGKAKKAKIDAEDMEWSMRLTLLHLLDTKELLKNYGSSDLDKTIKQVEELKKEFKAQGKILKARDVIARVRSIKNVSEAHGILNMVGQ